MIRDEDGMLTGYVYIDLATSDYGSYVDAAQLVLDQQLHLPTGYTLKWSGEYEFQLRARERLKLIMQLNRLRSDLCSALYALSIGHRIDRTHSSDRVRDDRRPITAVHDGL